MNILNRAEISRLIRDKKIITGDTIYKDIQLDYYHNSSLKPCSVYLHLGEVYIPEQKDGARGSLTNPVTDQYVLEPGEVVLVRTEEVLNIPADIGGICFAPANFSLKGLLIVNIGHIDPGYKGKLHFNVVNLGKEKFPLQRDSLIAKLLIFGLSENTVSQGEEEYIDVGGKNVPKAVYESLPLLSKSFMNFKSSTEERINQRFGFFSVLIPILSVLATLIIPKLIPDFWNQENRLYAIEKTNAVYEVQIEDLRKDYEEDLQILEEKIKELEKNTLLKTSQE